MIGHILYRIMNTPIAPWPFPHAIIENVFPDEFYDDMMDTMPRADEYDGQEFGGMDCDEKFRTVIRLDMKAEKFPERVRGFWADFMQTFMGNDIKLALMHKFQNTLFENYGKEDDVVFYPYGLMCRDEAGYALGVHPDQPTKAITCVFYLPNTPMANEGLGTSLYVPLNPEFTKSPDYNEAMHYTTDGFMNVMTVPYRPNSCLIFAKTDNSWHGVEKTTAPRDTIQLQIIAGSEAEWEAARHVKEAVYAGD